MEIPKVFIAESDKALILIEEDFFEGTDFSNLESDKDYFAQRMKPEIWKAFLEANIVIFQKDGKEYIFKNRNGRPTI